MRFMSAMEMFNVSTGEYMLEINVLAEKPKEELPYVAAMLKPDKLKVLKSTVSEKVKETEPLFIDVAKDTSVGGVESDTKMLACSADEKLNAFDRVRPFIPRNALGKVEIQEELMSRPINNAFSESRSAFDRISVT